MNAFEEPELITTVLQTAAVISSAMFGVLALKRAATVAQQQRRVRPSLGRFLPFRSLDNGDIRTADGRRIRVYRVSAPDPTLLPADRQERLFTELKSLLDRSAGAPWSYMIYRTKDLQPVPPLAPGEGVAHSIEQAIRNAYVGTRSWSIRHHLMLVPNDASRATAEAIDAFEPTLLGCLQSYQVIRTSDWAGDALQPFLPLVNPITRQHPGGGCDDIPTELPAEEVSISRRSGIVQFNAGARQIHAAAWAVKRRPKDFSTAFATDLMALPYQLANVHWIKPLPAATARLEVKLKSLGQLVDFIDKTRTKELANAGDRMREASDTYAALAEHCEIIWAFFDDEQSYGRVAAELEKRASAEEVVVAPVRSLARHTWLSSFPPNPAPPRRRTRFSDSIAASLDLSSTPSAVSTSHWSEAPLTYFPMANGVLYPWQFQAGTKGNKPNAHGKIIGDTGGGKTTAIERLLSAFLTIPRSRVYIFDADDGTYVWTRANGGAYVRLSGQDATSTLNPWQWPDSPESRDFLHWFLTTMIEPEKGDGITASEISRAIEINFHRSTPPHLRNLRAIRDAAFLRSDARQGYQRVAEFTDEATYGRLFTGERNLLNLGRKLTAFDLTQIASKEGTAVDLAIGTVFEAILLEMHRDPRPTLIFVDEAATANRIDALSARLEVLLERARKLNGAVWFGFQTPAQIRQTRIADKIHGLTPTTIIIPNGQSSVDQYQDLKLSEAALAAAVNDQVAIPALSKMSWPMVIHRQAGAALVDNDLGRIGRWLSLFEGTESAKIWQALEAEHGEDASTILPLYFKERARA